MVSLGPEKSLISYNKDNFFDKKQLFFVFCVYGYGNWTII